MKLGKDLAEAKSLLENDQLVAIPTETVYGLAANGLHPEAVVKIFEAKQRPSFNPLILHVASVHQAEALTRSFPDKARELAEAFWPGPLTLVLPAAAHIPSIVTAGLDTVGIRVPDHPLTLELLNSLAFPLAAPSANPSGYISPTAPEHVAEQLGDKVAYILDGGPCTVGVESTIVRVDEDRVTLLRLGGIELERIEELVGPVLHHQPGEGKMIAPGMMRSHYAPSKKVLIGDIDAYLGLYDESEVAILSFRRHFGQVPSNRQLALSPAGDLAEAARNIFDYLRRLDNTTARVILAEFVPDKGLGRAINDRLARAAADRD